MKKVNVYELRKNIKAVLEGVYILKEPVVVYKYDKPIATIQPIDDSQKESFESFFGFLKEGESGVEYEKKIRRNAKEIKRAKLARKGKYEDLS